MVPINLERFGLSGSLILVSKLKKLRTSILKNVKLVYLKMYKYINVCINTFLSIQIKNSVQQVNKKIKITSNQIKFKLELLTSNLFI